MRRFKTLTFLIFVLAIWFALSNGISLYIDSLWFDSVGYLQVFTTTLSAKLLAWLGGFAACLAFLSLNFWLASRRSIGSYWIRPEWVALARKGANGLFWLLILGISALLGFIVQSRWLAFLQYAHRFSGGPEDPIFQEKLTFFFFSLPVWNLLAKLGLTLLFFTFGITAAAYAVHGHIGYLRRVQMATAARAHLLILLAASALLVAARFWLMRFDLLYSRRGVTFGASYTDLNAQLPAYWILIAISCLAALLFLVSIFGRTFHLAAASVVVFVLAYLLAGKLYPSLVQTFVVAPNELEKETPYIEHNIRLTTHAYNLHQAEVQEFAARGSLDMEKLDRNPGTIRNIRLWDWRPLKDCYDQLQSIRPYYEFQDIDIDRYTIDGNYRQVMLAGRELDFEKVSQQAQSWINRHFQYTHGYGICLSPVNEVSEEGQPEFFIKDIPPSSSVDVKITRPEIYFGEKTTHPVFVRTRMEEFDYPIGDQNATTTYQAERGLLIGSFLRRLLFAWELGSYEVLFTPNFTGESRVLLHRRIQERVGRLAPFLHYDQDPYVLIHEGRLYWLQDAYTVSDRYPYSEPYQGRFNYIRNSVKVVMDAYLGDVDFYMVDPDDPLIQVYARIFPNLFKPLDSMPAGIREHIRYPEDLFNVQREMFSTYHMREPVVFYNKEDLWEVPNEIYAGDEQRMESYYVIMTLPGSEQEELILLTPFTPRDKNNMIAWLAGRSDREHYGKLILYQFPKQKLTYGPMQIEARIDQDPLISQLITLWSQKGSRVIRGNLLVVPIEEALLYVEPLYLQAEKSEIPELTRIIVVYENQVAIGETLAEALRQIFAGARLSPPRPEGLEPAQLTRAIPSPLPAGAGPDLARRALEHFRRSQDLLRQGEWAAYGEEQRKLGEVLKQLAEQKNDR